MRELADVRFHLGYAIRLLKTLEERTAELLNYTVDLSPAEAQGLSLIQERINKALTTLNEVI